jgi:hypothetical protein
LDGWQGFEGEDLDVVIDLGKIRFISSISVGFLQNPDAWIFLPEWVTFSYSKDGKNYQHLDKIRNENSVEKKGSFKQKFIQENLKIKTRYIKIMAKNIGVCPSFHPGSGKKAWIFADEIIIN